jgi:hypothetical protein
MEYVAPHNIPHKEFLFVINQRHCLIYTLLLLHHNKSITFRAIQPQDIEFYLNSIIKGTPPASYCEIVHRIHPNEGGDSLNPIFVPNLAKCDRASQEGGDCLRQIEQKMFLLYSTKN